MLKPFIHDKMCIHAVSVWVILPGILCTCILEYVIQAYVFTKDTVKASSYFDLHQEINKEGCWKQQNSWFNLTNYEPSISM